MFVSEVIRPKRGIGSKKNFFPSIKVKFFQNYFLHYVRNFMLINKIQIITHKS
jgi:hypothetical protein